MRAALGARPAAIGQQRRQGAGGAGRGAGAETRPRRQQQQQPLPLSARARETTAAASRAAAAAGASKPNAAPTAPTRRRRGPSAASAASAAASAAGGADGGQDGDADAAAAAAAAARSKAAQLRLALGALALSLAALGAGLYHTASAGLTAPASAAALKAAVAQSPLGRSGLLPAFSLIFLSEVGDKTFFIAALLAAKLGRAVAFFGSMAALATMTAISVAIGALCSCVPEALRSSLPLGEVAGTVLLVAFGVRALREAAKEEPGDGEASAAEGELADAREVVEGAVAGAERAERVAAAATGAERVAAAATGAASPAKEGGGAGKGATLGARLLEVATLIFLAEWGDRSMLATVALGAAQSPWAVAVGATAGHAAATAIAVVGGALAGARVSERAINATSGVLFLLFAAATIFTAF